MLENIVILGHSFVRELREMGETQDDRYNLGLNIETTPVWYVDRVDGEDVVFVDHIYEWLEKYPEYVKNTTLLCLDLGTNDLKAWHKDAGRSLAAAMFTAAIRMRDAGVQRVCIYEIMYRDGLACVPLARRAHATPEEIDAAVGRFNRSVDDYNDQLKSLITEADIQSKGALSIEFLPWKGIKEHHPANLRDGLHLTAHFKEVYWRNMRRNVIREAKKARPMRLQDLEKYLPKLDDQQQN